MTATRVPVTPENSTVLGYPGTSLWSHLRWDKGAWVDHSFGLAYLHVAACHPDDDWDEEQTWYRVRPINVDGCVDVEQQEDGTWCWVYEAKRLAQGEASK